MKTVAGSGRRFLRRLCCVLVLLCCMPAHAKTLKDTAKWFGPHGDAMELKAEIDGHPARLDEAVAYLATPAYRRELDRISTIIRPMLRADRIPCINENGNFRYRSRDPLRAIGPVQDWGIWEGNASRNLRWAHHGLSLTGCYLRMLDQGDRRVAAADLKQLISGWYDANAVVVPPDPEFSWGDHTIAFRLRRTIAVYLALRDRGLLDEQSSATILKMVYSHTRILLEDPDVRMKNSNHALDQAQALFMSGATFPFLKYPRPVVREAYRRAKQEGDFLIAPDGVQVENSPAYHQWVPTKVFALLTAMSDYLDEPLPDDLAARMSGATRFATWIVRPDGMLPPIGDTGANAEATFRAPRGVGTDARERLEYVNSAGARGTAPQPGTAVFPDAGYFIYRNRWSKGRNNDDVHLVFKCGFLSQGHRHDDDGSIVLYGVGTDWLTDAGLYAYEHASAGRRYVVSPMAHNVSVPTGMETVRRTHSRKYRDNRSQWGLSAAPGGNGARCQSYMYSGADYRRDIALSDGSLQIHDRFSGDVSGHPIVTLFRVPMDKTITNDEGRGELRICDARAGCLAIGYDTDAIDRIRISRGSDASGLSFDTAGYMKMRDVQTIRLFWSAGVLESDYRLGFDAGDVFAPAGSDTGRHGGSARGPFGGIAGKWWLLLSGVGLAAIVAIFLRSRRRIPGRA